MFEMSIVIAVAEDNRAILELASNALRMQGYEVLEVKCGTVALDAMECHERPVDLLLTDVEMPGIDGITLWHSIRARRPQTKVVFMSGSATTDDVDGAPLLSKPFTIPKLVKIVKDTLQLKGDYLA